MARPVVTPTTEQAYGALGVIANPDALLDFPLLRLVASVGDQLETVNALARDTDDGPGWSVVMDPTRAPADFLPWLGQFVGVRPLVGLSEVAQRRRIQETAGFQRGTVDAIAGAARQWLTGSRQVGIIERDGSAYRFRVRTYAAETPDPARVEAAILAQKPAGLVLTYEVVSGATYTQMDGAFVTYADQDAALTDYESQTLHVIV